MTGTAIRIHEYRGPCKRGLRSVLILEDGTVIKGCGFGYPTTRVGEVVFTTSIVGYTEALTDPSFKGHILVLTYPLIGNYGVPAYDDLELGLPKFFESDSIKVEGLVVAYETDPSHWTSKLSLHDWLYSEGVPGLSNVDTRMLVKRIRDRGAMMGLLKTYPLHDEPDLRELLDALRGAESYDRKNLVELVSVKEPVEYVADENGRYLVLVDYGVKYGTIRELLKRGFNLIRIPYNEDPLKYFYEYDASGIVLSSGPGSPTLLEGSIRYVRGILEYGYPLLGICLGHQIIGLASGLGIFKLKYGHRGGNKPCVCLDTGSVFVTSQNHGYALISNDHRGDLKVWFINADDRTIEGLKFTSKPVISVQFRPEASPGPRDTSWVFDEYVKLVAKYGNDK